MIEFKKSVTYKPPDEDILLDKIQITPSKELYIRKQRYGDKWSVDIRFYVNYKGQTGFTRKGIFIPVSVIDSVIAALNKGR